MCASVIETLKGCRVSLGNQSLLISAWIEVSKSVGEYLTKDVGIINHSPYTSKGSLWSPGNCQTLIVLSALPLKQMSSFKCTATLSTLPLWVYAHVDVMCVNV